MDIQATIVPVSSGFRTVSSTKVMGSGLIAEVDFGARNLTGLLTNQALGRLFVP